MASRWGGLHRRSDVAGHDDNFGVFLPHRFRKHINGGTPGTIAPRRNIQMEVGCKKDFHCFSFLGFNFMDASHRF